MSRSVKVLNLVNIMRSQRISLIGIATRLDVSTRTAKRYLQDIRQSSIILERHQDAANIVAMYSVWMPEHTPVKEKIGVLKKRLITDYPTKE